METLFDTREARCKLRKAFAILRREGVITHMRYVCCMQCGKPEAPFFGSLAYVLHEDEMEFKSVGVLPVWFCSPDEDPAGTRALGHQVRIALEMSGLLVDWNGDPSNPIMVIA